MPVLHWEKGDSHSIARLAAGLAAALLGLWAGHIYSHECHEREQVSGYFRQLLTRLTAALLCKYTYLYTKWQWYKKHIYKNTQGIKRAKKNSRWFQENQSWCTLCSHTHTHTTQTHYWHEFLAVNKWQVDHFCSSPFISGLLCFTVYLRHISQQTVCQKKEHCPSPPSTHTPHTNRCLHNKTTTVGNTFQSK